MLDIYCTVDRTNRPEWMKRLLSFLSGAQRKVYDGTSDEMAGIYSGVVNYLRQLMLSGQTCVILDAELIMDNSLSIKRNGRTFIEIRFI